MGREITEQGVRKEILNGIEETKRNDG